MRKCKECRFFVKNPFNSDGECEKEKIQQAGERICCNSFKMKLTEREIYILDFSRRTTISRNEYKEYTGLKEEIFNELIENGCVSGKGIKNPSYCFIQEDEFKKTYPNIFG